jgi:hypothetical protein
MKFVLILGIVLFVTHTRVDAQFGRIMDRVTDRVASKVEDKVVDAIANEIMKKAFKPAEKSFEEAAKQKFEDSLGNENVDYNKMGKAYGDFLAGMNGAVDKVKPTYTFDTSVDMDVTNEKGKVNKMLMLYTKTGDLIGYQTNENKEISTVVFDVKNDIMIMYKTDKKGNKEGQVIPNVLQFATALAGSSKSSKDTKEDPKVKPPKIAKSGGSKSFAGYLGTGYLIEADDIQSQVYISDKFPVSYAEVFNEFAKKFAPSTYVNNKEIQNGYMLYSKTSNTSKKKETNTMEVKKVTMTNTTFTKSEYKFQKIGE